MTAAEAFLLQLTKSGLEGNGAAARASLAIAERTNGDVMPALHQGRGIPAWDVSGGQDRDLRFGRSAFSGGHWQDIPADIGPQKPHVLAFVSGTPRKIRTLPITRAAVRISNLILIARVCRQTEQIPKYSDYRS